MPLSTSYLLYLVPPYLLYVVLIIKLYLVPAMPLSTSFCNSASSPFDVKRIC